MQGQLMPKIGVVSGVVTPKTKTKPLRLTKPTDCSKGQDPLKICGKFLVFPSAIKRRKFALPKSYHNHSMEVK